MEESANKASKANEPARELCDRETVGSRTAEEIEVIVRRLVAMALMHESGPNGGGTDHRRALVLASAGIEIVWTRGGDTVRALVAVTILDGPPGVARVRRALMAVPFATKLTESAKGDHAYWFEVEMSVGDAQRVETWAEANGGDQL